jgi:hypothetical protein
MQNNNHKYDELIREIKISEKNREDFQKVLDLMHKAPEGQKVIKFIRIKTKGGNVLYN